MPAEVVVMSQAVTVALVVAASPSASVTGTGLDLTGYEGVFEVTQNLGVGTTITVPKLEESDVVGSGYTAISGATFGTTASAMTTVKLDVRNVKRFVRYTNTIATGPVALAVNLTGFKKVKP